MDDLGVPLCLETPIYHFYTTYSPCQTVSGLYNPYRPPFTGTPKIHWFLPVIQIIHSLRPGASPQFRRIHWRRFAFERQDKAGGNIHGRMSCWKEVDGSMVIGSMVNGFFHLLINGVYWSYTSRILTFCGRYPVILGERFGATDDAFSYSEELFGTPESSK